jgi:hypothetical protein
MPQTKVNVSAIGGGVFHTEYSGIVRANARGIVVVDSRDTVSLVAAGGFGVAPTDDELKALEEEAAKASVERQEAADKRAKEEYPEIYAAAEPSPTPTPAVAPAPRPPNTPART